MIEGHNVQPLDLSLQDLRTGVRCTSQDLANLQVFERSHTLVGTVRSYRELHCNGTSTSE